MYLSSLPGFRLTNLGSSDSGLTTGVSGAGITSSIIFPTGISLNAPTAIGVATIGLYLIEGIAGLPVFSNSPERGIGLAYFTGPTMGYLIGFLSACFLASFVKLKDNYLIIFSKLILAVSTIYIFGILWLGTLIGWDKPIFDLGVKPFLLAEIFKIALLVLIAKKIFKFRKLI